MPSLLGDSSEFPGAYDVQHDDGTTGTYPASTILSHPVLGPQALLMAAKDPSMLSSAVTEGGGTPGSPVGQMLMDMTQGMGGQMGMPKTAPTTPEGGGAPQPLISEHPAAPGTDKYGMTPQQRAAADAFLASTQTPGTGVTPVSAESYMPSNAPYKQKQEALRQEATDVGAQHEQQAQAADATLADIGTRQKAEEAAYEESNKKYQEISDAADAQWNKVLNTKIDPTRAIGAPWQKALAVLSMGVGGFYGGYSKTGKNPGSEIIQQAIENDVKAQIANLENQKSGAQRLDSKAAINHKLGMDRMTNFWNSVASEQKLMQARLESIALHTDNPILQDHANQLAADSAIAHQGAVQEAVKAHNTGIEQAGKATLDLAEAAAQGVRTDPSQGKLISGLSGKDFTPAQKQYIYDQGVTPQNQARVVRGPGGEILGAAPTADLAKPANESNMKYAQVNKSLDTLRGLNTKAQQHGGVLDDPKDMDTFRRERAHLALQLAEGIKGTAEQPGVRKFSADEIEKILPPDVVNPRNPYILVDKLFGMPSRRGAAIDDLTNIIQRNADIEAQQTGVPGPGDIEKSSRPAKVK